MQFSALVRRQQIESLSVKELNQSNRHSYKMIGQSVPPVGNWASKEHAGEHSHGRFRLGSFLEASGFAPSLERDWTVRSRKNPKRLSVATCVR